MKSRAREIVFSGVLQGFFLFFFVITSNTNLGNKIAFFDDEFHVYFEKQNGWVNKFF